MFTVYTYQRRNEGGYIEAGEILVMAETRSEAIEKALDLPHVELATCESFEWSAWAREDTA